MVTISQPTIREIIGGLIKKKRLAKGLSQDVLARELGLSRTYINLIESGRKVPPTATLSKIAVVLGTSENDLVIEAELHSHDPEMRLPYLMSKLLGSGDKEKLSKLVAFVESLE